MDWRSRIVAHPDVLVGKPVIKGTRISVELVRDLLAAGYTTDQIIEQYDHLTREDIQACLAYAKEIVQTERVYAPKRDDWAGVFAVVERDRIRVRPVPGDKNG